MLPSRPVSGGPFTRSVREALEAAVSPAAAQNILGDALKRASLPAVPEEIEPFRRFCEGAFRAAVRGAMGDESVEQVFERLGHVLWMATSDVSALEAARAWSRGTGQTHRPERDEDSGVRHVEPPPRLSPPPPAGTTKDLESGPSLKRPTVPAPPPPASGPVSATSATLGRMRAPTLTTRAATGSRPGGSATEVRSSLTSDPRRASTPPPAPTSRVSPTPAARFTPLPPSPTPVRTISSNPPERAPSSPPRRVPTAVLVLTLDTRLPSSIRTQMAGQCPVRTIGTPGELATSIGTAGPRPVVLVDTALPSIDVPTFAGLAPILPAGARVVLWGAAPRQQERLAVMFPHAATWVASGHAADAGQFILELA